MRFISEIKPSTFLQDTHTIRHAPKISPSLVLKMVSIKDYALTLEMCAIMMRISNKVCLIEKNDLKIFFVRKNVCIITNENSFLNVPESTQLRFDNRHECNTKKSLLTFFSNLSFMG